jgi:hypothetical protein
LGIFGPTIDGEIGAPNMGGGGCSLLRTRLKGIGLLLNEKFKIERQSEGQGQFPSVFSGL